MRLQTRLTEKLKIEHPVLLAPMGVMAGGRLAAAVSNAGGMGILGGGYGDADWLRQQFKAAGKARIGCGFITWAMARDPALLDLVLDHDPAVLMLSFGAPKPHAEKIKKRGIPLICQVQAMTYAREAVDAGADIIVAEGCEAGGHSGLRSTFSLVPEVADYLAKHSPETILVAAGGVADGRHLSAALMLGAEGVLVGTRFLVAEESEMPDGFRQAVLDADGDATMKSNSVDVVRGRYWPNPDFVVRVIKTGFVEKWHGHEREMEKSIESESQKFWQAFKSGDAENSGVLAGEAIGVIHEISPAAKIIDDMVAEACRLLKSGHKFTAS